MTQNRVTQNQANNDASDRLKGIALMIGATVGFSILDTTAKYLTTVSELPVEEVIWLRFFWHFLLTILVFGPLSIPQLMRTKKLGLQTLRSLLMLGATGLNFAALQYLQLDQVTTVFFLTPLLVAGLAGPILGEWIGWRRFLAICTGFSGVILVTRPGFGGVHPAILFSFGATLSYALYNISTRFLSAHDPSSVTQFYTPLAGLVIFAPFAYFAWSWPQDIFTWILLVSLGVSGGFAHWLLIEAHKIVPAPVLAPFVYVGIISMSLLGYTVFDQIPSIWTLSGGAVVIASGLYLLAREKARSQ